MCQCPFITVKRQKSPPRSWCVPIHSLLNALNSPEEDWVVLWGTCSCLCQSLCTWTNLLHKSVPEDNYWSIQISYIQQRWHDMVFAWSISQTLYYSDTVTDLYTLGIWSWRWSSQGDWGLSEIIIILLWALTHSCYRSVRHFFPGKYSWKSFYNFTMACQKKMQNRSLSNSQKETCTPSSKASFTESSLYTANA